MNKKVKKRINKHYRIRKKVVGTAEKPRISVFRSLQHIYVQFIDDVAGKTLASSSSLCKDVLSAGLSGLVQAEKVGELAGTAAVKAGIKKAVFDRGGFKYHGRVKAVAESLRKAGLDF